MARSELVIQPCEVKVRHVRIGASTDPGAVKVLDTWYAPQNPDGVNGDAGWATGEYERCKDEEGTFTLTFPNQPGADGIPHLDRFVCCSESADYRPGDEWLEIRRVNGPGLAGETLLVGTPLDSVIDRSRIVITGADALTLLRSQRETAAGIWTGQAPRDVFSHYTQAWLPVVADGFDDETRFTHDPGGQTTSDGAYAYVRCQNAPGGDGVRIVAKDTGSSQTAALASNRLASIGADVRGECVLQVADPSGGDQVEVELFVGKLRLAVRGDAAGIGSVSATYNGGTRYEQATPFPGRPDVTGGMLLRLAIERRGRWAFFYAQDQLAAVLPTFTDGAAVDIGLRVKDMSRSIDVKSLLLRELRPLLQRGTARGTCRIPGGLSTGGLVGEWFDDGTLFANQGAGAPDLPAYLACLSPVRDVKERRLEATLDFPSANPVDWQPLGVPAEHFSLRLTGAIYLDLDTLDYAIRATADDRVRVWIGDTRWGQQLIDDWTAGGHAMTATASSWLKAGSSSGSAPAGAAGVLAGERSGWFPIVVEYANGGLDGGLKLEIKTHDGTTASAYAVPAKGILSPQGVVKGPARLDSHFEQLMHLRDTFGLQFSVQPRPLEHQEFPGLLVPLVRAGQDTAYVIDSIEGDELTSRIDAREACDTLVLDAQGLADQAGGGQLTREAVNYPHAQRGRHLALTSRYDSIGDVTLPELAETRAAAMLLLSGSPWEEVGVRPLGRRDVVDRFPITGEAALFAWQPGDGVRLDLPELGVRDSSPRQLTAVRWPIRPDGLGRPDVRLRQRPRGLRHLLRSVIRAQRTQARVYQGQLTTVQGSVGSVGTTAGADAYSRAALPTSLADVVTAELVVLYKSGSAVCAVEVNDAATTVQFMRAGRIDITASLARHPSALQQLKASITGHGSELVEYMLELRVRI